MNKFVEIFFRYLLLLIIGLNLNLFFYFLIPLTIKISFFILNLYYDATISNNLITLNSITISIIPACVGISAYYLLLILNLSTPLRISTRIKNLLFLWISFFVLNILRIVLFSILALKNNYYFELIHFSSWYFLSTILVILLWFSSVRIFKIKTIPIYSDFKTIKSKKWFQN
jgi:exosortase/archaeosortase